MHSPTLPIRLIQPMILNGMLLHGMQLHRMQCLKAARYHQHS